MEINYQYTVEAFPREGMTLDELELEMARVGNPVIERREKSLVVAMGSQTLAKIEVTHG